MSSTHVLVLILLVATVGLLVGAMPLKAFTREYLLINSYLKSPLTPEKVVKVKELIGALEKQATTEDEKEWISYLHEGLEEAINNLPVASTTVSDPSPRLVPRELKGLDDGFDSTLCNVPTRITEVDKEFRMCLPVRRDPNHPAHKCLSVPVVDYYKCYLTNTRY